MFFTHRLHRFLIAASSAALVAAATLVAASPAAYSSPTPADPTSRVNDPNTDIPSLDSQSNGVVASGAAPGFLVSAYQDNGALHFVCAPYDVYPMTGFSVSTDGGATWTDKGAHTPTNADGPSPCVPHGPDPSSLVCPGSAVACRDDAGYPVVSSRPSNGRIVMSVLRAGRTGALVYPFNEATQQFDAPAAALSSLTGVTEQWSATDAANGDVYVAGATTGGLFVATSSATLGFGAAISVASSAGETGPRITVSGSNRILLSVASGNLVVRIDSGSGFGLPAVLGTATPAGYTGFNTDAAASVAVSGSNVYVAWSNGGDILATSSATNGSAPWSTPVLIANSPSPEVLPSVAASPTRVAIGWTRVSSGQMQRFVSLLDLTLGAAQSFAVAPQQRVVAGPDRLPNGFFEDFTQSIFDGTNFVMPFADTRASSETHLHQADVRVARIASAFVPGSADVSVAVTSMPAVEVGNAQPVRLVITNNSGSRADFVTLGVTATGPVVLRPTSGLCSSEPVVCSLGAIDGGGTVTVDVLITGTATGSTVVTATVGSANDSNAVNDVASASSAIAGSTTSAVLASAAACTNIPDFPSVYPMSQNGLLPDRKQLPNIDQVGNCPLAVSGLNGVVRVTVDLRINHTWVGDLILQLVAPDGTVVSLDNRTGVSTHDFGTGTCSSSAGFTTFDDNSPTPLDYNGPRVGTYLPAMPLRLLTGSDPNGTWRLRATDVDDGDVGSIDCWQLHLTTAATVLPPTTTTTTTVPPTTTTVPPTTTTVPTTTTLPTTTTVPPTTTTTLPLPSPTVPGLYHPLDPARIFNSRNTAPVAAGTDVAVPVTDVGGVPATGVGAVTLNVTSTGSRDDGYLTLYPCGGIRPDVSNVNYSAGQNAANLVTVKVPSSGQVCVFSFVQSDVIIDVSGWYGDDTDSSGLRFTPLDPKRIFNSRTYGPVPAGQTVEVPINGFGGVPATGVGAVTLNVTSTASTDDGFLAAFPCGGSVPDVSNVNYGRGRSVANLVTVKVPTVGAFAGKVCVYSYSQSHVIIDVSGYFGDTGAQYYPLDPTRIFDTRAAFPVDAGTVVQVPVNGLGGVPLANVGAVTLNATSTASTDGGFLSVYPCGAATPDVSNVNYSRGQNVANLVTVKVPTRGISAGHVCIYSYAASHVIVDVSGWFGAP